MRLGVIGRILSSSVEMSRRVQRNKLFKMLFHSRIVNTDVFCGQNIPVKIKLPKRKHAAGGPNYHTATIVITRTRPHN